MTEIRIPFSGFYNSFHDSALDDALEQAFHDYNGMLDYEAYNAAYERVNWQSVRQSYAKEYASILSDECALPGMTFNRLVSPREYNFDTDHIICDIPADTLADIYARADKTELSALVADRCEARDGFIPFYSDSLDSWGAFETWESPQIDLLIESWCNEYQDSEWRDCFAMESVSGNGYFNNWLAEAGAFNEGNN
jgi:hypothetical protein